MGDLQKLYKRYEKNIQGQLSCFDRIILYGTFGNIAYHDAMAWELKQANCKFINYTKGFANELRLEIKDYVKDLATREDIIIEPIPETGIFRVSQKCE